MHELSADDCKAIIARRDSRYDGHFYFGVKTTGIYCRPVCPAKPKPENITIFRSPSEAEQHGYRPCRRCRPDAAPGSRLLAGTAASVARALRIIQDTADSELNAAALADTLGMSDRHLRRLFDEHLGASPVEIMITQRLHFAKQILQETSMPVADTAFAAGFQSVRRFNEAFKARYHASPREFRRAQGAGVTAEIMLRIPVRLPYDWAHVLAYLARHAAAGLEVVDGESYVRFLPRNGSFGSVRVTHETKQDFLQATFTDTPLLEIRQTLTRLKALFDTAHNPADLPRTGGFTTRGIRVPGSFDPFETAVAIILGQLVSTEHAKTSLKRLIERFGRQVGTSSHGPVFSFPAPETLAVADVAIIGLTRGKAQAIRTLAADVASGAFRFNTHADFGTATQQLLAMPGIGPWTADMIAMRCLGNPDAFPERDLIVHRAKEQSLYDASQWGSSRAYLVHCLWRDYAHTLTKSAKTARKTPAKPRATSSRRK